MFGFLKRNSHLPHAIFQSGVYRRDICASKTVKSGETNRSDGGWDVITKLFTVT